MKVLFISPSFFPATYYGGPIGLNQALCEAIANSGEVELQVLTTDADGPYRSIDLTKVMRRPENRFDIHYCRRNLQPDVSLGLLARLPQMIQRTDVVHIHGVYCFTTLPTLALCWIMQKPVVWSGSGALQRWSDTKHRLSKLVFEKL